MIINTGNLRSLYTGFSTAFAGGLGQTPTHYKPLCMVVPSTTKANEYGWIGQFPRVREWLGDRVVQGLAVSNYTIRNRPFELTIGVNRDDIEDDNIGIYAPMFDELGRAAGAFPDELVFPLLTDGFTNLCYDGKAFFASDHPVLDKDGVSQSVSNTGGGSGAAWFLMDLSRGMKPLIWQSRKPFTLTPMADDNDEAVFTRKEFRYGYDGRCNAGYAFWQLAYGSKQTLDAAAFAAAKAAMMGFTGDGGRPLGIMPNTLVVGKTNEAAARTILKASTGASGAANIWFNAAELMVVPWLP